MGKTSDKNKSKSATAPKTATTKTSKRNAKVPKPGEEGYLTPSQLRNARKRRAKKQARLSCLPRQTTTTTKTKNNDPSLQYISNPKGAPIVRTARDFFRSQGLLNFPIYLGPCEGWRTVAKLAVRNNSQNLLTIGLFAPGTHELVPTPNCPAHHPSINAAIQVLQAQARKLYKEGMTSFDETRGSGLLRHVAMAVQRATGKVQLTLVWNSTPQQQQHQQQHQRHKYDTNSVSSDRKILKTLVKALLENRKTNGTDTTAVVSWHSIWVHYNAAWKHSNAIFSNTGEWELLHHFENDKNTKNSDNNKTSTAVDSDSSKLGIIEYLNFPKEDNNNTHCPLMRVPLYFPPNVFRQANLSAFQAIVFSIRKYIIKIMAKALASSGPIRILELYGGVGTIGLHLSDLCRTLISSDENPHNVACFETSAQNILHQLNRMDDDGGGCTRTSGSSTSFEENKMNKGKKKRKRERTNIESSGPNKEVGGGREREIQYHPLSATAIVQQTGTALNSADVIIVDPPRKGLEDVVSSALVRSSSAKLLVYVSCGFDAFQRDYKILTSSTYGTPWTLDKAEGHILFPGSNAIETLAFFKR